MKHTTVELLEIVYRYYVKESWPDHPRDPRAEETRRLVAARLDAIKEPAYGRWCAMLDRIEACFSGAGMYDRSACLSGGAFDAAYTAKLVLPSPNAEDGVAFMVSLLAPYYMLYRARVAWENKEYVYMTSFDLAPDQEPYARGMANEIEATYGYERMPREIGTVNVPEVAPGNRGPGGRTLYDCLFSDDLIFVPLNKLE